MTLQFTGGRETATWPTGSSGRGRSAQWRQQWRERRRCCGVKSVEVGRPRKRARHQVVEELRQEQATNALMQPIYAKSGQKPKTNCNSTNSFEIVRSIKHSKSAKIRPLELPYFIFSARLTTLDRPF